MKQGVSCESRLSKCQARSNLPDPTTSCGQRDPVLALALGACCVTLSLAATTVWRGFSAHARSQSVQVLPFSLSSAQKLLIAAREGVWACSCKQICLAAILSPFHCCSFVVELGGHASKSQLPSQATSNITQVEGSYWNQAAYQTSYKALDDFLST